MDEITQNDRQNIKDIATLIANQKTLFDTQKEQGTDITYIRNKLDEFILNRQKERVSIMTAFVTGAAGLISSVIIGAVTFFTQK